MEKINKDLDGKSSDIIEANLEEIKRLFPECFSEGKLNFESLETLLGKYSNSEERYSFSWPGKESSKRVSMERTSGTLRFSREKSFNPESTENVFIDGDNLEVLKILQKSYHKKIKVIYIDPPYNTGNEFIYPDRFQDNLDTYLKLTKQKDKDGFSFSTNTDKSGRYHTNWLNMMYPRLRLARNLLTDDGAIFINIDDNEAPNLRKILDEIFGEENFVGQIAWKHTQQSKNDERFFSRHHNYLICYKKSDELKGFKFPRTDEDNINYSNPDNDPRGPWRTGDVRSPNPRPTLKYDIITPSGNTISPPEKGWRWSKQTLDEKIATGEIKFNEEESKIIRKIYLENQEGRTPETVWDGERFGTTRIANAELKSLFGENVPFDTPKPTALIYSILELFHKEDDFYLLDFFAGSATSAHAVMKRNVEQKKKVKFIMVQLPEPIDSPDYQNIADVGRARVRLAAKELSATDESIPADLGFKSFFLDSSNIKEWLGRSSSIEDDLFGSVNNIIEGRSEEDILYELLVKYGLNLTVPIQEYSLDEIQVYSVGFGAIIACFAEDLKPENIESIGKLKVELGAVTCRVIFRDTCFKDDSLKVNAVQTLKQYGIEDVKSI